MRLAVRLCVAIVVIAAAACSSKGTDTATSAPPGYLPLGMLSRAEGGAVSGVYADPSADDPDCCWVAGSASFQVRANDGGQALVLNVFVPDLPVFQRRAQSLRVTLAEGTSKSFTGLTPGVHFLNVPLPAKRPKVLDVALKSGFTFSPSREHVNGDTRELALYVKAANVR